MLEKVKMIQEMTSLFSGADVYFMPNSEPEVRKYLTENVSERLGADLGNHEAVAQICALGSEYIYEFTPFPGIAALIYSAKTIDKILFIGPVTTESYTSHNLLAYLQQQSIPQKTVTRFIEVANRLPVMRTSDLYGLMDILLRHICGLSLPVPVRKMEPSEHIDPISLLSDMGLPKDISQIRLIEDRYETSSILTEAVKLGNLSLALHTLQNKRARYETIVRNQNPLRNMQNQCIILNTQLRHSLEGTGIHPYELDHLSNEIGMQIERLNTPESAVHFSTYIIEQYCRLVQEQSYQNLSGLTHQAVIYIKNNLHANLTVKDTAKELSVHPDYLSHQFSQEMGMTFINFLNRERCMQAASFLKHTGLQIKQISAIVGFNTISYFTKQFTQVFGKTPRDFRNERIFRKQSHPV